MFVVVVTLQPRPLPSLGLDERFTRIDYTAKCTMLDILEDMARVLRVPSEDITLLEESGEQAATLERTLGEYHDQHAELASSFIAEKWHQWPQDVKRQRKQINLKVKYTPMPQQLVTCTVEGGEGRNKLRRATVQLPNTATFGELLELARKERYGALEFEGPVYGGHGELDTTLPDAWVRSGCKIDGTLHIGLAVVVSFPTGSQKPLSLTTGPGDTVNEIKEATLRDEPGDWPASLQNAEVGPSSPSSGASRRHLRPCHSTPHFSPLTLDPHDIQETKAGGLRGGGGSAGDRLSSRSGGVACPIIVFALSPSGRVFTLSMRRGASVLDAKGRIASFEGVPPRRQRLLWRGVNMEPDGAPLHKLGVRNGDTLIVGYKLALPEVTASVAEQEGSVGDENLVAEAEVMQNQNHHTPEDGHHVLSSDTYDDNRISAASTPTAETAEAAADGDEGDAVVAREDSSSAAIAAPADARLRNDGVDVTGGEGGGRGGGGGGAALLPSGSAADEGDKKAGRRRAWWSRKKPHSMRRPGDSDEPGRDGNRDEGLAGVLVVPPSASSSTTFSPDSVNGVNARRARVAPAPEEPVHLNASAAMRQPLTLSVGRTSFTGWGRWGRRMPA